MQKNQLNKAFFKNNRNRLKKLVGKKTPVVIAANSLLQRTGDTSYAFCQDANFWYLTGCNEPDVLLVIDSNDEYLILPDRVSSRMAFEGFFNVQEITQLTGIDLIIDRQEGKKLLRELLSRSEEVATLLTISGYQEQYGMYLNPATKQLVDELKSYKSKSRLIDITQHLVNLRVVKQLPELEAIQTAIDITINSFQEVLTLIRMGKINYEFEIEAELTQRFIKLGADGHAFLPIIAGGQRACILHNAKNSSRLSNQELLLCDIGAEYKHYAADITRTISMIRPTSRQKIIYQTVKDTQEFAISLLRPGILLKDYELKVVDYLGEKLQRLGLIKNSNQGSVFKFMPHSISHFVGLNVHDVGNYRLPLEPGMVITVEPGIYINEESIGIRIEDDVLVTEDGNRVLSQALSSNIFDD